MLHEATHIMFGGAVDVWKHDANGKDHWYAHGLEDHYFGGLFPTIIDSHRHSMFQIEVEFLSDLVEYGNSSIPRGVLLEAKSEANATLSTRFSNTVPWSLGTPRPM